MGRRAPSIQESYKEDVLLNVSLRRSLNALYIMLLVFCQRSQIKNGDGVWLFCVGMIVVMIAAPFFAENDYHHGLGHNFLSSRITNNSPYSFFYT